MRLVWIAIPLLLFGIIGVQESFAEDTEFGYGESNVIEYMGIDFMISATYVPDTVPYDGYNEGILTLRLFDRNSNQTAENVTYRVEILRDDMVLAKNLYYSFGMLQVKIQPDSNCNEIELWKCTEQYSKRVINLKGATFPTVELPPIRGPLFDKPGTYTIKIDIEGLEFDDINVIDVLNFELSLKLGGESSLSNTFQVLDRRSTGLMEYTIPYDLSNGTVTDVNLICNGAEVYLSLDNLEAAQLVITIPKKMVSTIHQDDYEFFYVMVNKETVEFEIIRNNPDNLTLQFDIPFANAKARMFFDSSARTSGWVEQNCQYDRLLVMEKPPKIQIREGVPIERILCYGDLELIFKSSDSSPACVKPSTADRLIERGWVKNTYNASLDQSVDVSCTTKLDQENRTYSIRYDINNAQITNAEKNSAYLTFSISSINNGSLYVELPRGLIDAKSGPDLQDDEFFVLIDGEEVEFTELKTMNDSRLLQIDFDSQVNEIVIVEVMPLPILDTINTCD